MAVRGGGLGRDRPRATRTALRQAGFKLASELTTVLIARSSYSEQGETPVRRIRRAGSHLDGEALPKGRRDQESPVQSGFPATSSAFPSGDPTLGEVMLPAPRFHGSGYRGCGAEGVRLRRTPRWRAESPASPDGWAHVLTGPRPSPLSGTPDPRGVSQGPWVLFRATQLVTSQHSRPVLLRRRRRGRHRAGRGAVPSRARRAGCPTTARAPSRTSRRAGRRAPARPRGFGRPVAGSNWKPG